MKIGHWLHQTLGYPWIHALEVATLNPGDMLVVHVANGWTRKQVEQIRDDLTHHLPEGVQCVVMMGTTRIEVVRVVDPTTRPLQTRPVSPFAS